MARVELKLKLVYKTEWERPAYGFGTEWVSLYVMTDEAGKEYVWKTTGFLGITTARKADGTITVDGVRVGDIFKASATVNGVEDYKGKEQTVLQRVRVAEIEHASEPEPEAKPEAVELPEGDHVRMKYSRFKKHYPDCVVVPDTYDEADATVEIVIPDGRMKPSGTRGKHFRTWKIYFADGTYTTAKAIDEAHAEKQIRKEGKEPVEIVRTYY